LGLGERVGPSGRITEAEVNAMVEEVEWIHLR